MDSIVIDEYTLFSFFEYRFFENNLCVFKIRIMDLKVISEKELLSEFRA